MAESRNCEIAELLNCLIADLLNQFAKLSWTAY